MTDFNVSRRSALLGGAAVLGAGSFGGLIGDASAKAPLIKTQAPQFYRFNIGEFQATVDASPQKAALAAERGLRDLDIKEVKSSSTEIDGKVTGRTALDKEVVITIKRQTESTCALSIRVGAFGDEALSQKIFEKIQARL